MRIKSSSSSRLRGTRGTSSTSAASGAQKAQSTSFSGLVEEKVDTEREARKVRSQLMQELSELARELEEGDCDKEEASRRFVGLVIRERYGEDKGKGRKKMEEAIADMCEDDDNFVSKLQAQLHRIAKS